jgi:uncharacterized protein
MEWRIMMEERDCILLLEKYRVPENIVRHVRQVSRVAVFLGRRMKRKGIPVNVDLVRSGALLHDIGKLQSIHEGKKESDVSKAILDKEKLPKEALIAYRHMLSQVIELKPKQWTMEEKIVYYADKRVKHDHIVPLNERILDLMDRYPPGKKTILACAPAMHAMEKELLENAEISAELKGLL